MLREFAKQSRSNPEHWFFCARVETTCRLTFSGGDVAVYVFDVNQLSLPTPFYSVLVSVSAFMALSTVFHSINSPDNSRLSHSVLQVLFLPYWSFNHISLHESLPQP